MLQNYIYAPSCVEERLFDQVKAASAQLSCSWRVHCHKYSVSRSTATPATALGAFDHHRAVGAPPKLVMNAMCFSSVHHCNGELRKRTRNAKVLKARGGDVVETMPTTAINYYKLLGCK